MSKPTLIILTMPACVQCRAQERYMEANGIVPDKSDDMSTDADALELARSMGFMQAPVAIVYAADGTIIDKWSGFNPTKVDEFKTLVAQAEFVAA